MIVKQPQWELPHRVLIISPRKVCECLADECWMPSCWSRAMHAEKLIFALVADIRLPEACVAAFERRPRICRGRRLVNRAFAGSLAHFLTFDFEGKKGRAFVVMAGVAFHPTECGMLLQPDVKAHRLDPDLSRGVHVAPLGVWVEAFAGFFHVSGNRRSHADVADSYSDRMALRSCSAVAASSPCTRCSICHAAENRCARSVMPSSLANSA